ncbi:hypothetical protein MKEN_00713900 [Mycena kentingensis (nom. inval.)]|nr:hypothetical protein MKEN_00713900 [Mycena kentingensis (nom. inval.)]
MRPFTPPAAVDPELAALMNEGDAEPLFVVVMGVSGTGKSTLGAALALALGLPFVDGDDLHPRSNVEKMARGEPLNDGDRLPWLRRVRATAEGMVGLGVGGGEGSEKAEAATNAGGTDTDRALVVDRRGVVIACSALKRVYRDVLRGADADADTDAPNKLKTYFVFIEGERDFLLERMTQRKGHFMKANMLDSQLATLEHPGAEEGVLVVSVHDETPGQVPKAVEWVKGVVKSQKEFRKRETKM